MDNATKQAEAWKKRVSSVLSFGATFGLPALGVGMIAQKLSAQVDALENVGDQAAQSGVDVNTFMRIVGRLDAEDTALAIMAMRKLQKTLAEVAGGSKEAAADLAKVGLDPKELAELGARDLAKALQVVAKAYDAAGSAQNKFQIASAAFGVKSAAEVAPVMGKLTDISGAPGGRFAFLTPQNIAEATQAKEAKTQIENFTTGVVNYAAIGAKRTFVAAKHLAFSLGHGLIAGATFSTDAATQMNQNFAHAMKELVGANAPKGELPKAKTPAQIAAEEANAAQHVAEIKRTKRREDAGADIEKVDKALTKQIETFGMSGVAATAWEAKTEAAAAGVENLARKIDKINEKVKTFTETTRLMAKAFEFPVKTLSIADEYAKRLERLESLKPVNFSAWKTGTEKLNEAMEKTVASKAFEEFTATRTPGEKFKADAENLKFLFQQPAGLGIDAETRRRSMADKFRALESTLPDRTQLAPSLTRGSAEEYRFRAQAEARAEGGSTPEETLKRIEALEKAKAKADELLGKQIIDAINNQAANQPVANF